MRERERETYANSALSAEPDLGLDVTTSRLRPEQKPRVGCFTDCAI